MTGNKWHHWESDWLRSADSQLARDFRKLCTRLKFTHTLKLYIEHPSKRLLHWSRRPTMVRSKKCHKSFQKIELKTTMKYDVYKEYDSTFPWFMLDSILSYGRSNISLPSLSPPPRRYTALSVSLLLLFPWGKKKRNRKWKVRRTKIGQYIVKWPYLI